MGYLDTAGLRRFYAGIKSRFAPISHTHSPANVGAAPAETVKEFTAKFTASGWTKSGSTWIQTVTCDGMLAAYDTDAPIIYKTGVQATDDVLRDALTQLTDGFLETMDGKLKATLYATPPSCDIQIWVQRRMH